MNKKISVIHHILFFFSIFLLAASLVFYLSKWSSYPEEIGIHFAPDGQYDVIASKFYGFYPHVAGGIAIAGLTFSGYLIHHKKTGLSVSEKGEQLFKTELCLTLDCLSVLLSIFFSFWSRTVSLQIPLDANFMGNLVSIMLIVSVFGIVSEIVTYQKYKIRKQTAEKSGVSHRLCRLIPWMLTAAGILILLVSWERLPHGEEFENNPDYYGLVYFANFNAFLVKSLLLIPYIVNSILLVILEIFSVKAVKAQKTALISLTDRLKLVIGIFFFWWNFLLVQELPVGIMSSVLFFCLCILFLILYFKSKK